MGFLWGRRLVSLALTVFTLIVLTIVENKPNHEHYAQYIARVAMGESAQGVRGNRRLEDGQATSEVASPVAGIGYVPQNQHVPHFSDDETSEIPEASPVSEDHDHSHKALHPIDELDIIGIGLACLGLMIAAAGGIGGGGILVPLYILVLDFHPKHAIPLSNITIFGGAITNTVLNLSKRHPDADRPLVDWDLILVMEPLTIGGALVGSFINKILPEVILGVMLVVLLVVTANRTLKKGIKSYKKETLELEKEKLNMSNELSVVHESLLEEEAAEESDALLGEGDKTKVGDPEIDDRPYELRQLLEGERFTPLFKVGVLTGFFIVVLTMNLLKGGGAFKSPLGIKCGSFWFWGTTAFIFLWVLVVSFRVRDYLVGRWRLKARLGYRYAEGDVEWNPTNTLRYPAICFFAGFFAGLFGVGGGIVKGPLMLEMGVHPLVASATSAVMILYTSFTATTSFVVFGLLQEDYAIALFCVGIIATGVGQVIVNHLIKKYKRPSFIVLSIGSVVALSALMMGGQSLYNFMFPDHSEDDGGGFCSSGD